MKSILIVLIILLTATVAAAVQVKATWQLNDPAEMVDTYAPYKRVDTEVGMEFVGEVDGSTSELIFEHTDPGHATYMLFARRGEIESLPAVRVFQPAPELPPMEQAPSVPVLLDFREFIDLLNQAINAQ
jgi:hypothetical protein